MLCWVGKNDAKNLKKANTDYNISLVFAKNSDDFKSLIEKGDYLVFSVKMAKHGIKKVLELVRNLPECYFHLVDNPGDMTLNEMNIQDEPNVSCMITPNGLIQEFLGKFNAQSSVEHYLSEINKKAFN
jgi:hypothetical protein